MVKGKAKAVGSFLGGIANNPGVVILGIVGITLIIFRDKISQAFADIGAGISGGLGDISISLPEIKFPDFKFPDFKFPDFDFKFPDFDFGGLFGPAAPGEAVNGDVTPGEIEVPGGTVIIPPGQTVDPDTGIVTGPPPTIESTTGKGTDISTLFGELRPQVFDTLIDIGIPLAKATEILSGAKTIEDLQVILNQANTGIFNQLQGTLGALDKSEKESMIDIEVPPGPSTFQPLPSGFVGGGPSFIGGSIFETPIANLSLSQIIDKFMVTASQAANILAIAKDDFGDFDFGTNTGLGIGSVVGSLPGLSGLGGNVSDPQFQGLTAQEIANILTGGNISNF